MIDSTLQNDLRARFNPDGSDLRKIQLRMLEMLKFIDKICRENNIDYWLSSGTCIGAVRHGGFIPWDDDCDVEMPEKDYKKFRKIMESMENPPFMLQTHRSDVFYYPRFAKLRDKKSYIKEPKDDERYKYNGIFVDIFPMSLTSSKLLQRIGGKILRYVYIGFPKYYGGNHKTCAVRMIGQMLIGFSSFILNNLQKIGKVRYLRHISPCFFPAERVMKEIFPLKRMKFEDAEFNVPGNFDNYLKRIYGNYDLPNFDKFSYPKHLSKWSI